MTEEALLGTLYRAYGDHPEEIKWPYNPSLMDVVVTQDHRREAALSRQGFTPVVHEASTQHMGRNPAEIINLGLLEHTKFGTEYVLLVSSGLQQYIPEIVSLLKIELLKKRVSFDVIFFVLESMSDLTKASV